MVSRRTICVRAFTALPSRILYWSFCFSGRGGEDFVATATLVSNVGLWIELRRRWAAWKAGPLCILMGGEEERTDINWYMSGQAKLKEKGISASHFYFCFIAAWAWPPNQYVSEQGRKQGEVDVSFFVTSRNVSQRTTLTNAFQIKNSEHSHPGIFCK